MNLAPILRQLSLADFQKVRAAAANPRERFWLDLTRIDPDFEYHIDLPKEDGAKQEDLADMVSWLADETRFPND